MATLPVPRTWTVGELLTAAKLNTDVRDGLNFLLAKPLAVLWRSSVQTVNTSSSAVISWDTEDIDRDGGHSNVTNPTRYTAQTAGWYHCRSRIDWGSGISTGTFAATLRKNGAFGTQSSIPATGSGGSTINEVSGTIFMTVGDYAEIDVFQTSGSDKFPGGNSSTRFEVEWVSAT